MTPNQGLFLTITDVPLLPEELCALRRRHAELGEDRMYSGQYLLWVPDALAQRLKERHPCIPAFYVDVTQGYAIVGVGRTGKGLNGNGKGNGNGHS